MSINQLVREHISIYQIFIDKKITYELEKTEVRELQILRDYSDYLSIFRVFGGSIYSSCSDGHIYNHAFPELNSETVHYDMAYDEEGNDVIISIYNLYKKYK